MYILSSLWSSFFNIVVKVCNSAEYFCYFLIAAFALALLFNFIHVLLGGK